MNSLFLIPLICSLVSPDTQEEVKKWDVNTPAEQHKQVEFTTEEGTWMNLDVSPDGKTVVFDLLGDIYSIPVEGGEAKLIRGGHAWEIQPRFSPDGKKLLFTSDTGGGDNIWMMNSDGTDPKQITKEDFRLLNNAVWMPDGNYIVARKHFTSDRSLGAGELWMYHINGGEGIQLTKRKNDQQDVNEPCVSPDGKYIYYSEDMYPGGYFQYNKNPNSQIYIVRRYNVEKGTIDDIVTGPGGAVRPQISPDGKWLAFVRREREKSCLYIREISSGQEWMAYDQLSKDQQEAWAIFGVYTNFNWMPDNKNVIIWSKGKIRKINVMNTKGAPKGAASQSDEIIPFKALSKHTIVDALHFKNTAFDEKFTAKVIRHAVTSPDEKFLVFNAVGYLYRKNLPDGKPERLTNGTEHEFEPAFSKDGNSLLYVTWNDEEMGAIWKYDLKTKKSTRITTEKGIYRTPEFSPDNKKIVYLKEGANTDMGLTFCTDPGIYLVNADGTDSKKIVEYGENPEFSKDGKRIFYIGSGYPEVSYSSCDLSGNDIKTHFTSKYANEFMISPDGNWVAFKELFNVYVAAFPASGKSINLTAGMTEIPVAKISKDAGINMHWSTDSKKLHWTLGEEYFTTELKDHFTFLKGGSEKAIDPVSTGLKVALEMKADKPSGRIALSNATIITMKGDEVIQEGTIIIYENKIESIGKSSEIKIPSDAVVVDCKGKTILPGLVDVHAHVGHFRKGLTTQKHWPYFANLAYGVTTTHDPSTETEMVFAMAELVKSGQMIGPRIFSTGTILYGADGDFKAVINSIEDARSAIKRTVAFGAFSVKSYNQPRREQRQMVIQAAREMKVEVVPEGGSTFFHNMTMILDGHTGIEHNIPVAPAYNDVIQLWKNSKTAYTPTLIVAYGAMNGENYWYQHTNVWEKTRLLNFTPKVFVDERSRHRTMIPESEYENGHILASQTCKNLADAGVKVNLGAHGQLQGLGAHWELWMLQQGGMTNHEALKAATLNGAEYIGMQDQIGSLEVGKLADLIVLDKNPLEDIRNSEFILYTMINGRLYEAETMTEYGKDKKKRNKFYWEMPNASQSFIIDSETDSFTHPHCVCGKH